MALLPRPRKEEKRFSPFSTKILRPKVGWNTHWVLPNTNFKTFKTRNQGMNLFSLCVIWRKAHLIWNVTDDAQVNGFPPYNSCHKSVIPHLLLRHYFSQALKTDKGKKGNLRHFKTHSGEKSSEQVPSLQQQLSQVGCFNTTFHKQIDYGETILKRTLEKS